MILLRYYCDIIAVFVSNLHHCFRCFTCNCHTYAGRHETRCRYTRRNHKKVTTPEIEADAKLSTVLRDHQLLTQPGLKVKRMSTGASLNGVQLRPGLWTSHSAVAGADGAPPAIGEIICVYSVEVGSRFKACFVTVKTYQPRKVVKYMMRNYVVNPSETTNYTFPLRDLEVVFHAVTHWDRGLPGSLCLLEQDCF